MKVPVEYAYILFTLTFYLIIEHDICYDLNLTDEQPPTIMGCPANKKYIINPSVQESIEATWTVPTVSDNTGSVNIQYSHEPGDTFTPGRHDIYVIATDASNNEETCHFKINVKEGEMLL